MSRDRPLVSVIMPTYNQAAFVRDAIESVLSQTYRPIQLVVRDDGSADGTGGIVEEYARRYPRDITLLDGGENLGITGNCNRLVAACRGTYVALFAGDDICLPQKVERQVEWLAADERCRVLCHHDVEVFDSSTGRTRGLYSARHPLRSGSLRDLIRYPAFCAGPSVMLRADCMPAHGFRSEIRRSSDWLFWMETLLSRGADNPGAGFIGGAWVRYRRHERNTTAQADEYGLDETILAFRLLASRAPELHDELRHAESERLASYGFRQIAHGHLGAGLGLTRQSFELSARGFGRSLVNGTRFARARYRTDRQSDR